MRLACGGSKMEQGGKMRERTRAPCAALVGVLLLVGTGVVSGAPNHSESRPPPNPQRPWHGQHDPYGQHDTTVHDPSFRTSHQSPPIGYSVNDDPRPPPARNSQAPKETQRSHKSAGPQNNQASDPVTTPEPVPNQFGGSGQTGGGGQTGGAGQTGGQTAQTGQSGQSGQAGRSQQHVPVILVPTDPPARQTASQIYEAQEKSSSSQTQNQQQGQSQSQGQSQAQTPSKQNPKPQPPQPAAPVPRATPIPLPAPSPTPTLPPGSGGIFKGDYVVKDKNGTICVRGSFNARLTIWYQSKRGGKRTVDQAALELPQRPTITGRCGTDKEPAVMDLRWNKGRYRLKLFFSVSTNGSKTSWLVSGVHFTYDTHDENSFVKPLSTGPRTVESAPGTDIFSAPISHSYKCSSRLQVDMTAADGEEATLVLQDTQIQPFHLGKNGNYGTRRECGADHYGDVIPLAVGLGLGALILLMIVAYYFHRRYQGPPYENM